MRLASTNCDALTSGTTFQPDSVATFTSLDDSTRPDGVVGARCGTDRAISSAVLARLPIA